jgi:N utilization substance protein A
VSASRDNDDIRRLFSEHVPEIASGAVSIVGIAREKGLRVMVAVSASTDSVCPVGSCVGMKGERVKTIMKKLPGDKIDLVRWADTEEDFIRNLLAPAKVERITLIDQNRLTSDATNPMEFSEP